VEYKVVLEASILLFGLVALALFLLAPQRSRFLRGLGWLALAAAVAFVGYRLSRQYAASWLADVVFGVSAAAAILSAVKVVTHSRLMYSALYLVLVVLATAALVLLMGGELLAAVLILVYAGAIIVVYIFVIMLAQSTAPAEYDRYAGRTVVGVLAAAVVGVSLAALPMADGRSAVGPSETNLVELGRVVLIDYVAALELAGAILLAAVIGAIALAAAKRAMGPSAEEQP